MEIHNYRDELIAKIQECPDSSFTVGSKEEILKNENLIDMTAYWVKFCHEKNGCDYEFAMKDALETHMGICLDLEEDAEEDDNSKILTVKDFATGDAVWILQENLGRTDKPSIHKAEVLSVGRKYVTLNSVHKVQYASCESSYLRENTSWGEAKLLFKTEKGANEYLEKQELNRWLSSLSWTKINGYSLGQLRRVKTILEPEETKG